MPAGIAATIRREGEDSVLSRASNAPPFPLPFGTLPWGQQPWEGANGGDHLVVRAVVRDLAPSDVVGSVKQGDTLAIIGNAEMAAAGWPGFARAGDRLRRFGRAYTVLACDTRTLRGVPVKHHLHLRGG